VKRAGAVAALLLSAFAWGCSGGGGSSDLSPSGTARLSLEEHLQRGTDLMRQGQDEGAIAEFKQSIAIDPKDARPHLQLGRLLASKARREGNVPLDGVAELKEAVRLNPEDIQAAYELADIIKDRVIGVYDQNLTVQLFERILKANPALYDIRLRYATWLAVGEVRLTIPGQGRASRDSGWSMEMARSHLEKVLDQVPPDSEQAMAANFMLAHVMMKSGQWPELVRQADLILQRFPNIPSDRKWQITGMKGHGYLRQGMNREALATFEQEAELGGGNRALWDIHVAVEALGGWEIFEPELATGYPKGFPEKYKLPLRPERYGGDLPPPGPRFKDIGKEMGIGRIAGAGPASWADYDQDGRWDLVACGCDTFCQLFRNLGTKFEDVTLAAGLERVDPGFGAVWGDYDGDGFPDLYIARDGWNGPGADALLHNRGNGTFEEVTAKAGIQEPGSGFNVVWFDYDKDGWLDLFVTNGVTLDPNINHLYRNRGDGTFENVTEKAGLLEEPRGGTIGVAVGDYDQDGWPDIFVHGRYRANKLYRNLGNGKFQDIAREAGVLGDRKQNGFMALAVDIDSDGDLDIVTSSLAVWDHVLAGYRSDYQTAPDDDQVRIYRNDGKMKFTDIGRDSGFIYPIGSMSANAGDLDNDGYPDLYFGTGNPDIRRLEPNILYMNNGRGYFVDRTRSAGVGVLGKGHGVTMIDWDGDGYLEIYAEVGGFYHGDLWRSYFFDYQGPKNNHWLEVELSQDGHNRQAVGASVTLRAGKLNPYQEVLNGRGFGSSDPPILHFGLGQNQKIEKLTVKWPDGTVAEIPPPPVDRKIRIHKGDSGWTPRPTPP
jgi:tetratricopeptide (TPR) repeat protein